MPGALAQLSLDGADRLVELLRERRAPLPLTEAARCLFALRQAPSALVRQLVDEVAEFERLVDPGVPVPETITRITGIRTRQVRGAPRIDRVLPAFLRFAEGAVLVAHNARFDIGFVDAELTRLHGQRLAAPVLDTVALARRLLAGRLTSMGLATLAERFDTRVRPCHRALPDAQATAELLAVLLGLAQEEGVRTVGDAIAFAAPVRRPVRARRGLARDVPAGPGVYLFRDATEQVLYVGKASDLRARVRSYFSGPPLRRPVEHALQATQRIETRPLGSELEASLVELELIQRLRPPANRRGAHPERCAYLTLTVSERVPRLSVTDAVAPGEVSAGPFGSWGEARAVAEALRAAYRLRDCRPARPVEDGSCLRGRLGACLAPCRGAGEESRHATAVAALRAWLAEGDGEPPSSALRMRLCALRDQQRYEEAARARDQLAALERAQRVLGRLQRCGRRSGVLLAPDRDDRFVQAFAVARGRVVARRRLPRAGDARLEVAPLLVAMEAGMHGRWAPFSPIEAQQARIVAAAFARPGLTVQAIPSGPALPASAIAGRRAGVPLRR
jgi:DNA polymerase-3 subunit epsilon